jgi:hypothetical protein
MTKQAFTTREAAAEFLRSIDETAPVAAQMTAELFAADEDLFDDEDVILLANEAAAIEE